MTNALTLYSSASAGTGSEFTMADSLDMGLMVFVPSGAYGASGVKLVARLSNSDGVSANGTTGSFDISAIPLSASSDARQITITQGGVYYYPNVGGLAVRAQSANVSGLGTVTIVANQILKR